MVWTFATYVSTSGATPVLDWLRDLPDEAQAAIDDRLLKMEALLTWSEKWISAYQGRKGIFELRIPFNKVQYRPLGCYSPHSPAQRRWFVILAGAIEKGDRIPVADLDAAESRLKDLAKDAARARRYEF